MARWTTQADATAETMGGGSRDFSPAPRGFYTIAVSDFKDGMTNKKPSRPMTVLECEIADEGPYFGKKVWHTIVQINKGDRGHGIMVHSLHAFGMPHDGLLDFDTNEFQGKTARVLLGIKPYTKVVSGVSYTNLVNYIEALYTDNNPQPDELPPELNLREPGHPGLSHSTTKSSETVKTNKEEEECPF